MNKKLAHIIIFIMDLLSFLGLWYTYHEVQYILTEITNHADLIEFTNNFFLMIVAVMVPIAHMTAVIEHFNAQLIQTYNRFLNYCVIFLTVTLFIVGISGSVWIRSHVEGAGYVYCRNASGISALARNLVYTKNMTICEELVEKKKNGDI